MSRGFVREDDQEEPPFIPPRAPLGAGVVNYVTRTGLALLEKEKQDLELDRKNLSAENDKERRHQLAVINGKLSLLEERIASAQVISLNADTVNDVRFGITVGFTVVEGNSKGLSRSFTIVGVDEANIKAKKIAFTAPIVRAMIGKRVGEEVQFQMGNKTQKLNIDSISCD